MSSVPPLKYWNVFLRLATSETASATPEDQGPMMYLAPSESIASSARRVALPALVSSSRVMSLTGLPWIFMPRSSSATFMPRSSTGPTSAKAPVKDHRPSMTTSFCCARSTVGKPSPVAAAATPPTSTSRRVISLIGALPSRYRNRSLRVVDPAHLLSVADRAEADALEALRPRPHILRVLDPHAGPFLAPDAG